MLKRYFLHFFLSLLTLLITTSSFGVAYAQACQPSKNTFEKIYDMITNLDIRRTLLNMTTTMLVEVPSGFLFGGSANQVAGCIKPVEKQINVTFPGTADCVNDAEEEIFCEGVFNLYGTSEATRGQNLAQSRVAGSLLGMALSAENAAKEPIPVNLALYVNDKIQDVPFLSTTLAQTKYADLLDTKGTDNVSNFILEVWKQIRNIAYAIMAIVMLVIGFMIITRKKINQQVVVNIEYAIPKIAIAIILITFSYPIGATIAGFGWNLNSSVKSIVATMFSGNFAEAAELSKLGIGGTIIAVFNLVLAGVGTGLVSVPFTLFGLIGVSIFWLYIQFKIVLIYIKLVIKVISAPFVFAIGAIPGIEGSTEKWFKEMFSGALAIVAMAVVIQVGFIVSNQIIIDSARNLYGGFFGGIQRQLGGVVAVLLIPAVLMFSCYYAGQMPEMIEGALMGDTKKKR